MTITLEQVDQVRERTQVSYQKAKEALEQTGGDVLEAIVFIEQEKPADKKFHGNASDFGNEVIKTLKDLLNSGKVNRIVVEQKDGKVLMNIPVTVGAIGALFLTTATVIGLIAALATGCVILIHKEDGEVINVNDKATDVMNQTKEKATKMYEATKSHVTDFHAKTEENEENEEAVEEEEKSVNVEVTEEDDKIIIEVTEE